MDGLHDVWCNRVPCGALVVRCELMDSFLRDKGFLVTGLNLGLVVPLVFERSAEYDLIVVQWTERERCVMK